jgi:GntR family transcriptional regulator
MSNLTAQFSIVTGSAEPIYRQLAEQVKRRIAAGQWVAGDEMPSVRELAQALAVNPMTVSKAFSQLEAQGLLERRRGLSMVVSARPMPSTRVADRAELLRPALERAATEAHQLGLSPTRALALFKTVLQETQPEEPV